MDSLVKIHPRRSEPSTEEDLRKLVGRQQTLAELGLRALSGTVFSSLIDEAVVLVAERLSAEYCAVLELLGDGKRLLLRSGVGWEEGVVGRATVGTDPDLRTGHTLISRGSAIVGGLREERQFDILRDIMRLLRDDHRMVSGLSTIIYAGDHAFGLLGAYTTDDQRWFTHEEARFLEAVAKVLGTAKERELAEERARLQTEEQTKRIEAAERRFRLLSEANELLSASLGCAATLASVARLAVPALADLCFVDMVEGDTIDRLVVMHADYVEENLAHELRHNYPLDSSVNHGTPKVLRTGRPEFIPEVGNGALVDLARDDHHLWILRRLDPKSYMCVPFQVRRQLVGAIGFVSAESNRHYDVEDLTLADSLTRCAALAIDRELRHLPEAEMARELIQRAKRNQGVAPAASPEIAPELTARQLEVLRLLSRGMPAKKISEELRLSETTVRNHIRALLQALGARSQLEAVARARQAGFLVE
jgi:DNA-binding CsgD family transcriptional regulator